MIRSATILLTTVLLTLTQLCVGQTISKKTAIRIAIQDTLTEIKAVKNAGLGVDSATKLLCWTIDEKTDVKSELKKIPKSSLSGNVFIYTDRIKLNAYTGEILSRERILIGRMHYNPGF